jgi:two-component system response regulator RegA
MVEADAAQASSTTTALAAARTGVRFDLILSDVVLGTDDGLALIGTLRELQPAARVIVMSGYSPSPERVAALSQQGVELLPKPFGAAQLAAALAQQGTA